MPPCKKADHHCRLQDSITIQGTDFLLLLLQERNNAYKHQHLSHSFRDMNARTGQRKPESISPGPTRSNPQLSSTVLPHTSTYRSQFRTGLGVSTSAAVSHPQALKSSFISCSSTSLIPPKTFFPHRILSAFPERPPCLSPLLLLQLPTLLLPHHQISCLFLPPLQNIYVKFSSTACLSAVPTPVLRWPAGRIFAKGTRKKEEGKLDTPHPTHKQLSSYPNIYCCSDTRSREGGNRVEG